MESMDKIKFTELCNSNVKVQTSSHFNLVCNENKIAILGTSTEMSTLELSHETDSNIVYPFCLAVGDLSKQHPASEFNERISMSIVYSASTVQQSHEFALDPSFVTSCGIEIIKPILLQADWAKKSVSNGHQVLATLTNFGALVIQSKPPLNRHWTEKLHYVNEFYFKSIFPLEKSMLDIANVEGYTSVVNNYIITAFAWDESTAIAHILYTANAAGCIVAFKFNEDFKEMVQYCILKTSLDRIIYMKSFDDFLLVANAKGAIQLFRIKHSDEPAITEAEFLWTREDRTPCNKAVITQFEESYYIVFTKSANVIVYQVSKDGILLHNSVLYVGGTKLTGLEILSNQEFIVTTINGSIRYIWLSHVNDDLQIDQEVVPTIGINLNHMQIIGVATTKNRNLWSFFLTRNKDVAPFLKLQNQYSYISLCKIVPKDDIKILSEANIKVMDPYLDYIVGVRLNILANFDVDKYMEYFDLINDEFPMEFNDEFLQKLQLKLLITKSSIVSQKINTNNVKNVTKLELEFLNLAIQLIHILCRLSYLLTVPIEKLSSFQLLSISCMKRKYRDLIAGLAESANNDNPLQITIERFKERVENELNSKFIQWLNNLEEANETGLNCGIESGGCSVSYVQLDLFNRLFCMNCGIAALEDESLLKELFSSTEYVKCTFCRLTLQNEDKLK